ncbi:WD40 repeat-like protein [Meira miltonrushii]|uniref:methylated diphthine methylhydrolase n=1 Tax=Meira miltonrushii TaxID=1280837 RepID=A0A316VKR9_9BASI|nr:WD40 repeat-like protein [Meira miltonrushii]PWN37658.1 WD40 repeat-like protein [Meira miltonrushii]
MAVIARSLYASSTGQSADSVESHPIVPGLFALGTYQVDQHEIEEADGIQNEDDGEEKVNAPPFSRKGTLRLMQAKANESGMIDVDTLCTLDTAAILDMKWMSGSKDRLGVVLANSTLSLYTYDTTHDTKGRLCDPAHIQVNSNNSLCLSLDWSDRNQPASSPSDTKAIISQSDGTLAHIYDLEAASSSSSRGEGSTGIETWKAHDYEAWIAAFDSWSPNGQIVWSGGDDLTLKGWDLRLPSSSDQDCSSSDDGRGVTTIQNHHLVQHLWAVGSYDEYVRLWDARQPNKPLSHTHVGGGIWRLKWHPTKRNSLLVGCMHDGFKVLSLDGISLETSPEKVFDIAKQEMTIQTRFDEHKSLAYGCDWDRGRTISASTIDHIYSCSFYDAMLHAWSHE